jgi:hypothetical protein
MTILTRRPARTGSRPLKVEPTFAGITPESPGAEISYGPHLLQIEEAAQLLNALFAKCAWERRSANYGNAVPRDEAYYGDPGTHYTYSRRKYQPLPSLPKLLSLKTRVEEATPDVAYANSGVPRTNYNGVLTEHPAMQSSNKRPLTWGRLAWTSKRRRSFCAMRTHGSRSTSIPEPSPRRSVRQTTA